MSLLDQEIRLEEEAHEAQQAAWMQRQQDVLLDGNARALPPIQHLMIQAFPKVKGMLDEVLNETARGFGAQYRSILRELGSSACATLALSMAVHMGMQVVPLAKALSDIGKAVISEVIYKRGERQGARQGAYVHRAQEKLKRDGVQDVKKIYSVMKETAKAIDIELDALPPRALITIGKLLMQTVSATGLVTTSRRGGNPRMRATAYLVLHPDIEDYVGDWIHSPRPYVTYPPMIIPPAQINPGGVGGMWHAPGQAASYRAISRMRYSAWRKLGIDPTPIIEPCMMLSSVPYRVNRKVLELLQRQRYDVMGLPKEPKKPPMPFELPEGVRMSQYISQFNPELQERMQAVATEYKVDAALYHVAMKKFAGSVMAINSAIKEASKYCQYDRIYLPTFSDTRGRLYYASYLTPQGVDAQRALLELGEGVPLGEEGLHWLKVHVAGCAGYDAENFKRRAKWVDDMMPRLREAVKHPIEYDSFWSEWDSPLSGWAAARELVEAIDSGTPATYTSHTITQWDATCSGLQHLSAMLRDEVGGESVNLVDSPERKADIYAKTASVTLSDVKKELEGNPLGERKLFLEWLLGAGIDRSLAKKPVMTLVYGATNRGMADYFAGYIREKKLEVVAPLRLHKVAMRMSDLLFEEIPKVVPAAVECMQWLQEIAAEEAHAGRYMEWTSPNGLRVVNQYESYHDTNMNIKLMGVHAIKIRTYKDKPDARRCGMAAVPNFVHTMDAAHMARVLWQMWNHGVYMASVHDSFGCAAAHAGLMHRVIREEFVKMYEEFDPIGEIAKRYGKEPPKRGKLDIRKVLNSSHFFC